MGLGRHVCGPALRSSDPHRAPARPGRRPHWTYSSSFTGGVRGALPYLSPRPASCSPLIPTRPSWPVLSGYSRFRMGRHGCAVSACSRHKQDQDKAERLYRQLAGSSCWSLMDCSRTAYGRCEADQIAWSRASLDSARGARRPRASTSRSPLTSGGKSSPTAAICSSRTAMSARRTRS